MPSETMSIERQPPVSSLSGDLSQLTKEDRHQLEQMLPKHDPVNHPRHYTKHPSGVECITITEWMTFNLGNAVKYIWRAGDKGALLEDLKKARWYLDREIQRISK